MKDVVLVESIKEEETPLVKETPEPNPLPTPESKKLKMKKKKIRGKKSMKPENFEVPDPLARRQVFGIV